MRLTFSIPGVPLAKRRHRTVPLLKCLSCSKQVQGQYRECPECAGPLQLIKNLSYSDSETVKYENLVSYCAKQAMQQLPTASAIPGMQIPEMFPGPIRVKMTFTLPIPASRQCSKGHGPIGLSLLKDDEGNGVRYASCKKLHVGDSHSQRPDCDNLIKSVLDGLNGVAFADDSIIAELTAKKVWGSSGGTEVEITEI